MSYKVTVYRKPIKTNVKTHIEASLMEFFIGLICAGFAILSYKENVLVFVPNAVLAAACFLVTFYNVGVSIQYFRAKAHDREIPTLGSNA